ncbi:interferon-induced protein 44-like [Colossoma macropomum]|uniref:interferon-induced protein 44-like n=1 Tax=Colossoma macropomum TaxID=42526 RepID=UPI0018642BEB|nr:interferon-induced protein 44-like [Colossoma macropomum]
MMGLLDFLLEVFKQTPTPPPTPKPCRRAPSPELDVPWRRVYWNEKDKILKDLEDLNPSVEPLRILLHGPVGAGKSCFVNSVQRVLLGRNTMNALENTTGTGESFTTSIKTHKMKKRGGGYYPFVFSDIMGLETNKGGIDTGDIIRVLEGHILDGYKFNPRGPISKDDKRYNPNPNLGDKIHCLVSIVPADTISRMDESVLDKMRAIRKTASDLSIPQVIVLTKVDNACEIVSRDLRKLYHSKKIKEKVEVSSYELGISLKNIYPVKNYHVEITEDTNVDVLILMALRDIVNFANDYAEFMY